MRYELEGFNTETGVVTHRQYTTSKRTAKRWESIPKIQFSDSGHGVVFNVREVKSGARRQAEILAHRDHVRKYSDVSSVQHCCGQGPFKD